MYANKRTQQIMTIQITFPKHNVSTGKHCMHMLDVMWKTKDVACTVCSKHKLLLYAFGSAQSLIAAPVVDTYVMRNTVLLNLIN